MDWALAIEHNHQRLLRNVAWLFTWLKLEVGETVETMPRLKRLTVLFVLRPTEAACRRVIFIAVLVRGIVAPSVKGRPGQSGRSKRKTPRGSRAQAPPALQAGRSAQAI